MSFEKAVRALKETNGLVEQASESELADAAAMVDRFGAYLIGRQVTRRAHHQTPIRGLRPGDGLVQRMVALLLRRGCDFSQPGMNETAPLAALPDETVEEVTNETYGALKALCERAAEKAMPGRVLNVRPGFIVGPHDPTDRFTYWPYRFAQGGEVAAPGTPGDHGRGDAG